MNKLSILFFLMVPAFLFGQQINRSIITERLWQQVQSDRYGEYEIYVRLKDRVDAAALKKQYDREGWTIQERTYDIITRLQDKAFRTQGQLITELRNFSGVRDASVQPFWIANVVFMSADDNALAALSRRTDIDLIDMNAPLMRASVESEEKATAVPDGAEPGLYAINAPAMWELGYTGYGTKAFVNDTGADPSHPSYDYKWVGAYEDDELGWFEYIQSSTYPRDCGNHGTHVLGTMVGLDRSTNDTVGVAFGAQWMGSPSLCGGGTSSNLAAFQYSLDPDNNPATVSDMPDVINNSWYDPWIGDDCASVYVDILNAMEASGKIAPVFSAGNEGPGEQTITPPHNINETLVNSFTVGALNGNSSSLGIADFSSRGPSICDGTGSLAIKPEVSAPGFQVRSCDPGDGYAFRSGTSMASPHVAGAILLLREAFPNLTAEAIKLALYFSARDLGLPGEDNVYGTGIIDVYAAYLYLIDEGYVPESPNRQLDALVYNTELWPIECANEVTAYVSALNDGIDTITSARIFYRVVGSIDISEEYVWQGVWAPDERISIALPDVEGVPSGEYDLYVDIQLLNGRTDDRPLNNRMKSKVQVSDLVPISPNIQALDDSDLCLGGSALVNVSLPQNARVKWYDDPVSVQSLSDNNPLTVGPVNGPDEVFSLINYEEQIGMADQSTGNTIDDGGREGALVFDVYSGLTLESVRVFASQGGGRIIALYESNGEVLDQQVISLDEAGEHVIELGFEVPPGNNYQLALKAGRPLSLTAAGADYPYEISSVLRIKRGVHPDWPSSVWPYFYDWKVQYDDPCGRQIVRLNPDQARTAADAKFQVAPEDPRPEELIQFIDNTQFATEWQWDFGDGNTSEEQNPYHLYQDTGTFHTSLWVIDSEKCSDFARETILVIEEITTSTDGLLEEGLAFRVFPNPVSITFNIEAVGAWNGQDASITIYNSSGQVVYFDQINPQPGEMIDVKTSDWANGTYQIQIKTRDRVLNSRIMKLE